ncbi:MAG TPA: multicopper oxidase domain-containing protein [Azospirillaceae bacterium]|nr:multicopper oxidase domain-containing protein [Azospirillaceae bacterium]
MGKTELHMRRRVLAAALAGTGALVAAGAGAAELQMPPAMPSEKGVLQLTAEFASYAIPGGTAPVTVKTRAFTVPGGTLLASPTIRVKPGDRLRIDLHNNLPYAVDQGDGEMSDTSPHGFDVLNVHTHGLHVSPNGHSDNVLLSLYPKASPKDVLDHCAHHMGGKALCGKERFDYTIEIPKDHPAGTYWYHPHKHGAVALHLGSGLAGALIVEDREKGIDSLPAVQAAAEKIMLLQEILYAVPAAPSDSAEVTCASAYFPAACQFGGAKPPKPVTANAKLSVNGQFNPTVTMQAGEVQLWRVVNMTVGNVVPFCLLPETEALAAQAAALPAAPELYVLAADGVPVQRTLAKGAADLPFRLTGPVPTLNDDEPGRTGAVNNEFLFLSPGQRLDLMVKAPATPGRYVLAQPNPATPPAIGGICQPGPVSDAELVMKVEVVAPPAASAPGASPVPSALPTQTELNRLRTPKSLVTAKDVPAAPTQGVVFGFTTNTFAPALGGASVVNGRPFTDDRVQRTLKLDQMDLWSVQSAADTHMFHIHTNPFQVVKRGQVPYAFPVWRDTVLINCAQVVGGGNCAFPGGLTAPGNNATSYGEVVQFLSRVVDFTGGMVMHCHNVTHQDNGMMELVEIAK